MTAADRRVEHVTCLGCGCACDDLVVRVRGDRIAEVENACDLGRGWLGDGRVPDRVLVGGRPAAPEDAVARLAEMLGAGPALIYLAPDLATEVQRAAVALADRLGARVDSVTSDTVAGSLLAAQRRGRATATLGEIRNRADVLVFWATDAISRCPRYLSRYALDPVGTQVPEGRAGRTVVAVDVGDARGPAEAAARLALDPQDEVPALAVMRATVLGRELDDLAPPLRAAADLARRMTRARYAVIVHDAEAPGGDPQRAEGLIGLAQALNGPTRAALSSLRAGGNRSGADAALTWQTGYPFAVDLSAGYPRYRPEEPASVALGQAAAVLVVGSAAGVPERVARSLAGRRVGVVGPRASEAPFPAEVAIDTGVAGIHDSGTGYRMDDVPLPLAAVLPGPPSPLRVLEALGRALGEAGRAAARRPEGRRR